MLGAEVRPAKSGSKNTEGRNNERFKAWINNPVDTISYGIGPHLVLTPYSNFVRIIIQKEIKWQLKKRKAEKPDYVIACIGGGSS
jgi:tryptophan synthase beta chain